MLNDVYERLRAEGWHPTGALVAVGAADRDQIASIVARSDGAVDVMMDNCPQQVVLGGSTEAVTTAIAELRQSGALCTRLPFDRLYHTAHFASFTERLREMAKHPGGQPDRAFRLRRPRIAMYSGVTAERFPDEPTRRPRS